MRLVIATPLYPPEIGGPSTYAKLLEEWLGRQGVTVTIVKFSDVRHLPKLIRHYAYYRRVKAAAREADMVLALDPVSVGLPAWQAAQKAGKPYVVKIVGDYAWEQGQQRFGITADLDTFVRQARVPFPVKMLRKIQTRVALNASRIIVPSEYLKGIVTAWGVPPERISVIYNAVPLEEAGTVPEKVAQAARPIIVTAGRLVPWKHIDSVIDAVVSIPDATLVVVGDGPNRAALESHARQALPGRSVFTGLLSHKDTLATMAAADAFVLNSSYEGLSHMLVEALALQVPTVATRVGGNPEVITDGEDGLLVPVADTAALADAIRRIVSDDALRARLAERATESTKRFSVEHMVATTGSLLSSL